MKRPRIWMFSLALAACCSWISPAWAQSPTDYVRGILTKVMAIQTDPAMAGEAHEAQRSQLIHQIIERSFDFQAMALGLSNSTTSVPLPEVLSIRPEPLKPLMA